MQNYVPCATYIANSIDYTCAFYNISLSDNQKQSLLNSYSTLPVFKDALSDLKKSYYRLCVFSNCTALVVEKLLTYACIKDFFEIKSFKPNLTILNTYVVR